MIENTPTLTESEKEEAPWNEPIGKFYDASISLSTSTRVQVDAGDTEADIKKKIAALLNLNDFANKGWCIDEFEIMEEE